MHGSRRGEPVSVPGRQGTEEPLAWPQPNLISIPHFDDERGSLLALEWENLLPFRPQRFYCVKNATPAARRGGHAHWKEQEVLLALAGSFTVAADNGLDRIEYCMDRSDAALFLPRGVWHDLYDFSANAICAVLASEPFYDKEDYCRDYQEFLTTLARRNSPHPSL